MHHHQPLQLLALGPGGQPPQVPHRDPGLGVGGGFGITYHSNCFDVCLVHLIYYTFFNFSAHSLVFIVVDGVEGDAVLQAVDLGPPGAGHQQLPEHGRQVEPLVRAVVRLQYGAVTMFDQRLRCAHRIDSKFPEQAAAQVGHGEQRVLAGAQLQVAEDLEDDDSALVNVQLVIERVKVVTYSINRVELPATDV